MTFPTVEDANRRLQAARVLVEEAFYGDAVSRAYYTACQAALAYLSHFDEKPKTTGGIETRFRFHLWQKGRNVECARLLRELSDQCQRCDYDGYRPTLAEARHALEMAEATVAHVRRLV